MNKLTSLAIPLSLLVISNAFAECGETTINRLLDAKATPSQIILLCLHDNQQNHLTLTVTTEKKIDQGNSKYIEPVSTIPAVNQSAQSNISEVGLTTVSTASAPPPINQPDPTAIHNSEQDKTLGCDISKNGCIDIGATGALSLWKAKSGTYNFFSASPEIRYRFKNHDTDNSISKFFSGTYFAIGSPLLSSLNQNISGAQSTTPTSVFKSNIYVAFGRIGIPKKLFDNSSLYFSPIAGFGWASQEIDKTHGIYDKGLFVYLGISTYLASFTW